MMEDMRVQTLCRAFALEYNGLLGLKSELAIDFIVTTCVQPLSRTTSENSCKSLERFIEGNYVKYNSNCGYVKGETIDDLISEAAQAFSHFTFERSMGHFLVVNLEGVSLLLTDPVMHTKDPKIFILTETNLNEDGFKFFFATHQCNSFCHRLGLRSNRQMLISGCFDFWDSWPSLERPVFAQISCAVGSSSFQRPRNQTGFGFTIGRRMLAAIGFIHHQTHM